MNIGIICKYPIPYGMAATTRIFSYSKGLLECGDKVDVKNVTGAGDSFVALAGVKHTLRTKEGCTPVKVFWFHSGI